MDFTETFGFLWGLIQLLIGLGIVVFVHELGHFLVAKWSGVKVTQFAVGFGKAIVAYRKGIGLRMGTTEPEYEKKLEAGENKDDFGETEYRLNYFPLGGYVKMLGQEDLDPTKVSDDPRAFNNKSVGARFAVVSAGVIMNLIFAVIFFIIAFMMGIDTPPAVVGDIHAESPAAEALPVDPELRDDPENVGLRVGDRVVMMDEAEINDFIDIKSGVALASAGDTLIFTVDRPDPDNVEQVTRMAYEITPRVDETGETGEIMEGILHIGIIPPSSLKLADMSGNQSLQALAHDPELSNAVIEAVNGEPIQEHWQFSNYLNDSAGEPLELTLAMPDGTQRMHTVDPETALQSPRDLAEIRAAITAEDSPAVSPLPVEEEVSEESDPLAEMEAEATTEEEATLAGTTDDDISQEVSRLMSELPETYRRSPSLLGLVPAVRIGGVQPGAPADGVLEPHDIIVRVGDVIWPHSVGQVAQVISTTPGDTLAMTVIRDGQVVELEVQPEGWGTKRLGIVLDAAIEANYVVHVLPWSGFQEMELMPGSRIVRINDQPIEDFTDIRRAIAAHDAETPLNVVVELPVAESSNESYAVTLDRAMVDALNNLDWSSHLVFVEAQKQLVASNPFEAAMMGFERTWHFIKITYVTLLRLAEGSVPVSGLSGPVGIAAIGSQAAQKHWTYLIYFLGLISVNLAVINFLPLPIVDGGLAVLLLIEKVRGKPVPLQVQSWITLAGLILLASIFIVLTYHDIMRWVVG